MDVSLPDLLKDTIEFLSNQGRYVGMDIFNPHIARINLAISQIENDQIRVNELEEKVRWGTPVENLLREMIERVPDNLLIVQRDGQELVKGEIPTDLTTRIGARSQLQIMITGPYLTKAKDSLAWCLVRARDVLRIYDATH